MTEELGHMTEELGHVIEELDHVIEELDHVIEELGDVTDEPLLKWGVGRGNKSWFLPSANCQVSYREAWS